MKPITKEQAKRLLRAAQQFANLTSQSKADALLVLIKMQANYKGLKRAKG